MQNLKRKIDKIRTKLLTNQQFLSNFDKNNRLETKKCLFLKANKRHLRADVLSLLSSALRPRLLSRAGRPINYTAFLGFFVHNRGGKSSNVAKIVVMTTILGVFGLFSLTFTTPVSAASLTLSVPTDVLRLDLQPNNTFTKSSSNSVSVKTDAFAGYTLSIKAKSSNDLVNGSNKISSITSNLTEDQYKASGNTNTWGYQPNKINGSANTAFLPGPTTSPSTIERTNAKNDTANNYNFAIGSKVDSNTPNGSYSNTFVFTATANTVSYSITYNLNSGTWNGTSPQTGNTVENTVKLDDNTPTKSGYEFKGWCNQQTSDENCGGTSYQPSAEFPLNNSDNTVTLWAMWSSSDSYRIYYDLGDGKASSGDFNNIQEGKTLSGSVILSNVSNIYVSRYVDGSSCAFYDYRLYGWCTQKPTPKNNGDTDDCSGGYFLKGATYDFSFGRNITMYAVYGYYGYCPCSGACYV